MHVTIIYFPDESQTSNITSFYPFSSPIPNTLLSIKNGIYRIFNDTDCRIAPALILELIPLAPLISIILTNISDFDVEFIKYYKEGIAPN